MHWEHGIKKCSRISSLAGSCINTKAAFAYTATAGVKKKSALCSQKTSCKRHTAQQLQEKLLLEFLAVRLVLLQPQFPAQFFNCAAEPEPLDHIKQVASYDTHKKRYDCNPPEGERI